MVREDKPCRPGLENRLFWLSSIFKTSFLGLVTGCGKKKKMKRLEDPMIPAPGLREGQPCLHGQVCLQSVQIKPVLGLIPPHP